MIYRGKDLDKILFDHSIWILSKGRSGTLANLEGSSLNGVNLEMANLPLARMKSVSLKGAYLQGANFRKSKLIQAQLSGARLDGADCEGADLAGADLSFTRCAGTNFAGADLNGSNFAGAKLTEVNFRGTDLRGVNFKNARLSFIDLREARLENVSFEGADLYETNFEGAYLEGINLEKTRYEKADFEGAIFSGNMAGNIDLPDRAFTDLDLENLIKESTVKVKSEREELSMEAITVNQDMLAGAFRELIDKVKSNLTDDQIKTICKAQQGVEAIENIAFAQGDIVTHNDQVAIKLDFKISYILSLFIDRRGNCIIPSSESMMNPTPAEKIFD